MKGVCGAWPRGGDGCWDIWTRQSSDTAPRSRQDLEMFPTKMKSCGEYKGERRSVGWHPCTGCWLVRCKMGSQANWGNGGRSTSVRQHHGTSAWLVCIKTSHADCVGLSLCSTWQRLPDCTASRFGCGFPDTRKNNKRVFRGSVISEMKEPSSF